MYIRSVSGKLIRINDIENTKLPGEQNNYKSTAKEFYGKDDKELTMNNIFNILRFVISKNIIYIFITIIFFY